MQHPSPQEARVAVLRGGTGDEFNLSLETGKSALSHFANSRKTLDILVDKDGGWFTDGVKQRPENILAHVDVVFNGLHGGIGEDGTIQRVLSSHRIPHTGSSALSSALSLRKHKAREVFEKEGFPTPRGAVIETRGEAEEKAYDIFMAIGIPVIFKPLSTGSGKDVRVAMSFPEMVEVLEQANENFLLVEEYVTGSPVSVAVLDNYRGSDHYALMPVEVELGKNRHFDHDRRAEYTLHAPSLLPRSVKSVLEDLSVKAHKSLKMRHVSQSDFMVTRRGDIYLLETNALPSVALHTPLVAALEAVGSSRERYLDHVIALALQEA